MESTQNPGAESGTDERREYPAAELAETGTDEVPETGTAPVDTEDQPFGSTRGEALSLVLFALMVVIGSACFVIW